jgi:hypothetical protein
MQTGEWIKAGPLNSINYSIRLSDGTVKTGQLRFTKSQQERFLEFQRQEEGKTDLALSVIALNPVGDPLEFSEEQIEQSFDVDQICLLNRIWLDKKVANPRLTRELDPKLAG